MSVPELLRSIPGLQVLRHANGNYLVSSRGAGGVANNFLVVNLDGIPLNSPVDGAIDWSLVPLDVRDIERIEVVRGPATAIYGGGGYAGAINIFSRRPSATGHAAEARALGGLDLQPAPLTAGGGRYAYANERTRLSWFITGRRDDTANLGAGVDHPANTQLGSLALLSVETGPDAQLVLELGGAWSRGGSLDQFARDPLPSQRAAGMALLAWRARELPGVLDSFEVWTRSQARVIDDGGASDPRILSYHGTKVLRGELGVNFAFDLHRRFHARLGAEGSLSWISAPYLDSRVFGAPRVGFGAVLAFDLFASDHLDLRTQSRLQLPGLVNTHHLALIYHRSRWALRLSAGSDLRPPTAVESAGQFHDPLDGAPLFTGNPKLAAPRHHSIELGSVITPKRELALRAAVYGSAMTRAIVPRFAGPAGESFDSDEGVRWLVGAELELDWRVLAELSVSAALGHLRFLEPSLAASPVAGAAPQNSGWTAALRLFGSTRSARVGYGLGADLISGRHYRTRVGVPSVDVDVEVPLTVYLDARAELQPAAGAPLWLSAATRVGLPPGAVESFFPTAATAGAVFIVGVEWRRSPSTSRATRRERRRSKTRRI